MELNEILPEEPTKKEKGPRFIIRDASFALNYQEKIEFIVENLISEGAVTVFYGEGGSKKTYSLISLAVCVSIGKQWLNLAVKQRKVLICDEESGLQRLSLRLGAALRGELADENAPIIYFSLQRLRLDVDEDCDNLQELITNEGVGLVIIDSLSTTNEGNEDKKEDMQPVMNNLRRLAESTHASIIVIHHENKTKGYRGSTAIKNSVDLMIHVESESGSSWVNFTTDKVRDGISNKFAAVATWTEDGQFYLTPAEAKAGAQKFTRGQEFILRYLKDNGPTPLTLLKQAAEDEVVCSAKSIDNGIYPLADRKLIYRVNKGASGRGVSAIYALHEEEEETTNDED